ncbi:MAG: NAD(P)-binding domain-containing protein, partial [Verrucomicrobiota bacterium]
MVSFSQLESRAERICVVGLGYVGLPLAVRLASKFNVIGFDINAQRVSELQANQDHTGEIESAELEATTVDFTADPAAINDSAIVIVT